jgi:dextranase
LIELLPAKGAFAVGESVRVEARGVPDGETISAYRLDRGVAHAPVDDGWVDFGTLPEGGYGVEGAGATSAFDILARPLDRLRYGFVSHYERGRPTDGVAENVRRFHLNAVQFYDWMYRHADLVPPADEFQDALGQSVSLATVRALAAAVAGAGALPLAYAAVYAVGEEAWPEWRDEGLFRGDGTPWTLGDFLWNVDPSSRRWLRHFTAELREALDAGFAGFHLDQYGSPKWAQRADGTRVDLAEAFAALIRRVAADVPSARLIFNNVNDFPTWATAGPPQAATYIEVWSPHTRLLDLVALVAKGRSYAPKLPVVLAAYLPAYDADEAAALAAEKLQLATVFSSGATALLHGEEGAVLSDPYYVRHVTLSAAARDEARRYFDFAVRYGDLLFDPDAVDVTGSHTGGENAEVKVAAPVPVSAAPEAGAVWCRVVRAGGGLIVHLIDLSAQADDLWATPKQPPAPLVGVRVSVLRRDAAFLAASPEDRPALTELDVERSGSYDTVEVPPFTAWSLLQVREAST